ncbi:MAG: hypothetical protein HYY23_21840 [Verrucomicrobia bacterium]|nr:hypothetical protein [Verrucomicrobiota bacterium]
MFLTLLLVTFVVSTIVSIIVARVFRSPVERILKRIIADELSSAWLRYLMFALYVVGISSGVRVWDLEKYITKPLGRGAEIVELTADRWVLEVYRTIISTLQGVAWVLLVFFLCSLFAFLVSRIIEARKAQNAARPEEPNPKS